jgi:hypothetical protein
MWLVWGVLVAIMAALHVYRSSLEKNEDDQIFLDESFEHEKTEQEAIVLKVNKVAPFLRVAQWLVAAMTIFVIAYYIRDILITLRLI